MVGGYWKGFRADVQGVWPLKFGELSRGYTKFFSALPDARTLKVSRAHIVMYSSSE